MLEKLDSTPLHERVYQQLRRALMAGLYPVGHTFSQGKIAAELGTSVMPVREAINRLVAERALKSLPKRGVIIPNLSRERYTELVRVRIMLEGMATEMAAEALTQKDLVDLSDITRRMDEIRGDHDQWQSFNMLNHEFHFRIYRTGKPEVLLPLIETLWLQSGPLLNVYETVGMLSNEARHERITSALEARDPVAARNAVVADIEAGYSYIVGVYSWKD